MSNRKRVTLPDPHSMISRVRAKLPQNCSVRQSTYCDHIIAMRMQGIPYQDIEKWLVQQGPEFRIPYQTIFRNLKSVQKEVDLPYAEEMAERWGGMIDIDAVREMQRQILIQRKRIDNMCKQEAERQKTNPTYFNKYIRAEMETFDSLVKGLHALYKNPIQAANERLEADAKTKANEVVLTGDAAQLVTDMILRGEIGVGGDGQIKPKPSVQ